MRRSRQAPRQRGLRRVGRIRRLHRMTTDAVRSRSRPRIVRSLGTRPWSFSSPLSSYSLDSWSIAGRALCCVGRERRARRGSWDEAPLVLPADRDWVGVVRRVPVSPGDDSVSAALVPSLRYSRTEPARSWYPNAVSRLITPRCSGGTTIHALAGRRRPPVSPRCWNRWFVDETYVKVAGTWRSTNMAGHRRSRVQEARQRRNHEVLQLSDHRSR